MEICLSDDRKSLIIDLIVIVHDIYFWPFFTSVHANQMKIVLFIWICLQNIEEIPEEIRNLYKTVWEISQKTVIKMAADRGAFIDQSQSLNIHIAEPNYGKLTSMHFYAWKLVCSTWDWCEL